MNFRQKNTATGVVLALAFALAIAVTPVFAVHDLDIFELEGNTVDAVPDVAPNNPDILSPNAQDWNNLIGLNGGLPAPITPTPPGGLFSGIVRDGLTGGALSGTGDQHLTQGSKNINDLDTWQTSTSGQTPGKDDLLASMSATYTNPANNNSLLYFAATRRESNGNATLGLWFFQRPINVNPEDGSFSDVHQDGDLFLISTFTEGGGASVIQAFKWIGNGLTDVTSSLGLECTDPLTTGDGACAIVNSSPITIPTLLNVTGGGWPGFPNNVVPAGRFFEGGIVLNSVFPEGVPCFSSFMFQTVSSQNLGQAAAKDILLGQFNTCKIDVVKACGEPQPDFETGTITYTIAGIITNTGGGPVTNFQITDVPALNDDVQCVTLTGTPASNTFEDIIAVFDVPTPCATTVLDLGEKLGYRATFTSTVNGGSDTVTVVAEGVTGGLTQATAQATCPRVTLNPNLVVTKTCKVFLVAESSRLVVEVDTTIDVCNTGQAILTNVTVTDPTISSSPLLSGQTLEPEECLSTLIPPITLTPSYNPSVFPGAGNGTFSNTVTATGDADPDFAQPAGTCLAVGDPVIAIRCTDMDTASCDLCPLVAKP